MVRVVRESDSRADLYQSSRRVGIEVAEFAVDFLEHRGQFVAHADVYGDPWGHPVVVLKERRDVVCVDIPHRVSHENRGTRANIAKQEVFESGVTAAALKINLPLGVAGGARRGLNDRKFAAKLEGVFPMQVGNVIEELQVGIWPDVLGPISAQLGEALNVDAREAEEIRIDNARIHRISGRNPVGDAPRAIRICVVVNGQER